MSHFGHIFFKLAQSHCGVRQGENLSPALFSLFLKDLEITYSLVMAQAYPSIMKMKI